MELINHTQHSKVAARLRNIASSIKNKVIVTVSEHAPESVSLTGTIPRVRGWRIITDIPLRQNGRKNYVKFLSETKEKEVWIKLSTAGGRSRIYVR